MAAFTTMALIGLGASAGLFAGKKLAQRAANNQADANATPQAPGPVPAAAAAPTPPPSNRGQAHLVAAAAGRKQRRRSSLGTGLIVPGSMLGASGAMLGAGGGIGTNLGAQPRRLTGY